ncbi:hypothetical protein EDB81DRAFT_653244 [Dactylonectria macrodidyma]|uniref:Uncharacterized protein n=1 Tax=Dactylonectria macrodidyma TaxID=307937 RepID=A0A9P9ERF8_9HYPO|nr:hypothetical protein EDB81DRAFT_653244 [Dactylonectria macrodidyma]
MEHFNIEPEMVSTLQAMSDNDLHALEKSYRETTRDKEVEVHIYVLFIIFQRTFSTKHLAHAAQRAKELADNTPVAHPDSHRWSNILDMMSAVLVRYSDQANKKPTTSRAQ